MEKFARIRLNMGETTLEIEGSEDFVKEEWNYIKEQVLSHLKGAFGAKAYIQEKKDKLVEFYNKKRPRGHLKTVTVFGYYLKHFEDKEEFNEDDLMQCYNRLGLTPPKVLSQSIRDVRSRHKYFDKGSKRGFYKISPLGERFVEEQMPK